MRTVCIFTVAVALGLSPLLAADSASLQATPRPGSIPSTGGLGFFATSIMVGLQDPAEIVPCWNCAAGAGILNVGIAAPLAVVESGSALTILLTSDNLSYWGQGSFTYSLVSGGKAVLTDSVAGPVYPAIWLAVFPINAPAPGRYILEGVVRTGPGFATKTVVLGQLIVF